MFRFAIIFLLLVAAVADKDIDEKWGMFKKLYSKHYSTDEEEATRRSVWKQNVDFIQEHNLEADNGSHSYRLGVNDFADKTIEEIVGQMTGLLVANKRDTSPFSQSDKIFILLPPEVDWRTKGWVTPVKNQGRCGSCWAFSATGALEAQHANTTGKLISLSEQNLVDCSTLEGNWGCYGGTMDGAFEYIRKNGIDTEESYPYKAKNGLCRFDKRTIGATLSSYVDVPEDELQLQKVIATVGPVSVAINAGLRSFAFYKSGVYDEPSCLPNLNHGVLAVGYGIFEAKEYWLVKNSWGESWGDGGYIKMRRNRFNQCGIASAASYPVV